MRIEKETITEAYLFETHIENIFINEYMPTAPGDYVKVYIYALFHCEHNIGINNSEIAAHLSLSPEAVKKAWTYWEEVGIIKKTHYEQDIDFNYDIIFLSPKAMLYKKNAAKKTKKKPEGILDRQDVKELFQEIEKVFNRPPSPKELEQIRKWTEEYKIKIEVIYYALTYSSSKNIASINYIEKILMNWRDENCNSLEDVKQHLEKTEKNAQNQKRVMKALGFNRQPTEAEVKIINKWFDVYECSMDFVLEACAKTSGIQSPNINYVNRIIENNFEKNGKNGVNEPANLISKANSIDLARYYSHLREVARKEREKIDKKVNKDLPEIKMIEEEVHKLNLDLMNLLIDGNDGDGRASKIRIKIESLNKERDGILTKSGFPIDYKEIKYRCSICEDTGVTNSGANCICAERCLEEMKKERSNI